MDASHAWFLAGTVTVNVRQPRWGWGPVESPHGGLSVLRPALSSGNVMLATYVI